MVRCFLAIIYQRHTIYGVRYRCALYVTIVFMTFVIIILTPFTLLRFYDNMSKMTVLNRMLPFRVAPKKLWCHFLICLVYTLTP